MSDLSQAHALDDTDLAIVRATQGGLPLARKPYDVVAARLGLPAQEAMARMQRMLELGVIRRIGVVPNHYALGYRANAMSVWDVRDEAVDQLGREVGALDFVSHCYLRPRRLPQWRYNLFAMLHGRDQIEVENQAERIAALLGDACHAREMLYSTRILKKTGLRI